MDVHRGVLPLWDAARGVDQVRPDQVMVNCAACHRNSYGAYAWMDEDGETHRFCSTYCRDRKATLRLVTA